MYNPWSRRFFGTTLNRTTPYCSSIASLVVTPIDSFFFKPKIPTHPHVSLSLSPFGNFFVNYNSSLPPPCQNYEFVNTQYLCEKSELLTTQFWNSGTLDDANTLHLQILKNGFTSDLFLYNSLINIYVRMGNLVCARQLFDEMPERNSVTWASLITGYTKNGMLNEACLHFKRMISASFLPNHYAFGSALRACQYSGPPMLTLGLQIHGLLSKTPYASDIVVANVLISMYGNCLASINDARRVFDETKIKNSISWNSIISVYSHRGDAVSAFELFSRMQTQGFRYSLKPNEFTFGSLIPSACYLANSNSSMLEQMLATVKKSGLLQDLYVGSALVSGFSKSGLIDYALQIFEQMGNKNSVSMNGLMVGLVRQKRGEEAAEVFSYMKGQVEPNLDSYVVLLSSFAEFSDLEVGKRKGQEVHGYVICTGLVNMKVAIGNGLVSMYAKCGLITDAGSVFRHMIDKDLVSWNTLISGLDQNGRFEDAVMSFCDMRRFGLVASNFTLISALSSCTSLGWIILGQEIHCEALKLGLDLDVSVSNALLLLYAEAGYLAECHKVFFMMPEYDQVSWNSIIGALADSKASALEAVKYFMDMMRAGWTLNKITFINILGAVSSISLTEPLQQIHAVVLKYPVANDCAIENALLACYGKCGEIDHCEKIFSRMSGRRDDVSWNSMISGYIHNELLPKAIDLVWFMMQKGRRLDSFTFATVLSACASVATLERGTEVHASAIRACLESDVVVGSAIVDMYAKCGRIDYASRFFELMPVRNVYSWNSMISGYARHGHGDKALKLFIQMKLHDQLPDHVTFVGVLSACSHVGLVDEGFKHFKSMSEVYGLAPKMEHYSCMVDLLGRAGELKKIEDFITKMPFKPNVLIWRTILGACGRTNGRNTELGQRAAEMLLELEPQNGVNYVLLANLYASGEKWEDVAKARMAMRTASVKKEAGCSWVTMKDGVHVFVAGDKSHPEKELIYEKLKELNKKMRDAGYIPEIKFALYDLEMENKEEILSYHSEKLAVAFVLTRKSELPIRIMKNLRVCGDCHSAFKYISKIVGRKIVLRDSNRFHHFDDGQCSCGDYWLELYYHYIENVAIGVTRENIKMQKKKDLDKPAQAPVYWIEISDSVSRRCQFEHDGQLSIGENQAVISLSGSVFCINSQQEGIFRDMVMDVSLVDDSRPIVHRVVESFQNKFFPSGYPYSVNEGYLRYTQFRALQHLTSATLSVLSTQSLLFAAGLRPTPAQATVVSWVLKDGMQHVGKLICSNLGARMDSEPKRWRVLADVLYDLGTGLEVLSPLCPHLFLEMAGLGNFAKGMAVVAARATRLPIYSSFAKEGNLSDLFAKGEAISTLFNVVGLGAGIHLASTVCSTMQGKTGKVSSPADLRYRESLLFPGRLIEDAGNVKVGRAVHKVVKPSKLHKLRQIFPEEKFLLSHGGKCVDMVLMHNATGEDALRGWLVAAYVAQMEKSFHEPSASVLEASYQKMNDEFGPFLSQLQVKGWHTDRFLDGTGCRFAM
ncbi:hypothetical protein G4B88_001695 [Cannabis sativa]|uniref:DYW domain-containing protein n=1 Tax=Cannabis sativa TaxID=3483 RepID=A0A7J6I366_CANSA|nr:hypothetical protein G4B88_001695 [Cannabis sativa]